MPINSIMPQIHSGELTGALGNGNEKTLGGEEFFKELSNSIAKVDKLMNEADEKMQGLVSGNGENIHEAMLAFEKAETAMKLMVQVRNKVLDAYTQILQMQV